MNYTCSGAEHNFWLTVVSILILICISGSFGIGIFNTALSNGLRAVLIVDAVINIITYVLVYINFVRIITRARAKYISYAIGGNINTIWTIIGPIIISTLSSYPTVFEQVVLIWIILKPGVILLLVYIFLKVNIRYTYEPM